VVIDLIQTYRQLARPWTHEELAVRYSAANRRGRQLLKESPDAAPERPIALLATAIPSAATLSVAIHLLHAPPAGVEDKLAGELLDTAETNAARCASSRLRPALFRRRLRRRCRRLVDWLSLPVARSRSETA
jgi:hypothetical protein